ncbi:TetR/AcrR family transcriptional regulator [Tenacibaculum sp. 190524A02b]|uniref:TetR/AcrR family transcriptional regulator n=1 Tax=Tenacibaculum vairaonense TaxID=3137860 RepID=UPI0031FAABAA
MPNNSKEVIINSAFELFIKQGYQKTSLKDIMEETQLSKGAIYHHFKSKHEIYLASLDTYFFKLYEDLFSKNKFSNFKENIKYSYTFFTDLINYIENIGNGITYPIRQFFLFQLESEQDPIIREKIIDTLQHYKQEVTRIIKKAQETKEITNLLSVSVITQQLISMIEGIAIHHSTLKENSKDFLEQKYNEVILPYLTLLTNQT